jgi:hypothetical protein
MDSRSLQAGRAIPLYIHGVAVLGEAAPQQLSHPCIIFDDQYAHHLLFRSAPVWQSILWIT